jgi:hypothetical protein
MSRPAKMARAKLGRRPGPCVRLADFGHGLMDFESPSTRSAALSFLRKNRWNYRHGE